MRRFVAFTDGGHESSRDVGAAACVVINPADDSVVKEWSEVFRHTTNNRNELEAIIKAVEFIPDGEAVLVFTDSQYSITVLRNMVKQFPKNMDIIERYRRTVKEKKVTVDFHFVKGHNGNKWNEYVDNLCTEAMTRYKRPSRNSEIDRLVEIYG